MNSILILNVYVIQCNAILHASQHIHHIPLMCLYVLLCYCVTFILLPVDRLPDVLKAESYAFVALPAEAFWDGQVNSENIKKGILCPIRDLPKTGWIHGITLFSKVCRTVTSPLIPCFKVPYLSVFFSL